MFEIGHRGDSSEAQPYGADRRHAGSDFREGAGLAASAPDGTDPRQGTDPCGGGPCSASVESSVPVSAAELDAMRQRLAFSDPDLDDAARLELIHRLEQLRAAVAAAQLSVTAAFATSRRAQAKATIATTQIPGVGTRARIADAERGIVSDIATMRQISPNQASRYLTFAEGVPGRLPAAFAALTAGQLSEKRLQILQRTTSWLSSDLQRRVDAALADQLSRWGDNRVEHEARGLAQRLDPAGACARIAKAESDRHVALRPAPEGMAWLGTLCPMAQGVAAWAALDRAAKHARATGDPRCRGQVMSDTVIERLTGQKAAEAVPVGIGLIMTDRVMSGDTVHSTASRAAAPETNSAAAHSGNDYSSVDPDIGTAHDAQHPAPDYTATVTVEHPTFDDARYLAADYSTVDTATAMAEHPTSDDARYLAADYTTADAASATAEPGPPHDAVEFAESYRSDGGDSGDVARVVGFGPIPGEWARRLALGDPDRDTPETSRAARTIRRLFTDPVGQLVAMESRSRVFTPAMAELIRLRDDRCRTPWCDAPIRHIDHITPDARGGPTALTNARGLCERCNYAAQSPRLTIEADPGPPPAMPGLAPYPGLAPPDLAGPLKAAGEAPPAAGLPAPPQAPAGHPTATDLDTPIPAVEWQPPHNVRAA